MAAHWLNEILTNFVPALCQPLHLSRLLGRRDVTVLLRRLCIVLQSIPWPLDDESRYTNGGTPFGGGGLKNWTARSPLFNTDEMKTPLLILAFGASSGSSSLEEQWEAYSTLYQQHKPV